MLPQAGSHLAARSSTGSSPEPPWSAPANRRGSWWVKGLIWLDFCLLGSGLNCLETKENFVPTWAGLPFFPWRFVTFLLLVGTCASAASVPHPPFTGFTSRYDPQVEKTRTKAKDKVWVCTGLNICGYDPCEKRLEQPFQILHVVWYQFNQNRSSWKA